MSLESVVPKSDVERTGEDLGVDVEVSPELSRVFQVDSDALAAALEETEIKVASREESGSISEELANRPVLKKTLLAFAFASVLSGCGTMGSGGSKEILNQSTEIAKTVGPSIVARKIGPVASTALEVGIKAIELAEQAEVARQKDRFIAAVEEGLKNGGGEVVNEIEELVYLLREANHAELAEYIESADKSLVSGEDFSEQTNSDDLIKIQGDEESLISTEHTVDRTQLAQKELQDQSSYDSTKSVMSAVINYGPSIAAVAMSANPALGLIVEAVDFIASKIRFSTQEEEDKYKKFLESKSPTSLLQNGELYYILQETGRAPKLDNSHKLTMDEVYGG